jgi:hypothetical protein
VLPFDMPSWSEVMNEVSRQSVMLSLKECYGYLTILGIVFILCIMMGTYRTQVIRLIPKMGAIRKWMSNPVTEDPEGSVKPKK